MMIRRAATLLALVALLAPTVASAQFSGGGAGRHVEKTEYAFIPYPTFNSALGFGLGLIGAAFYQASKTDTISPASTTGLFVYGTTNKTWVLGGGQQFYLLEDRLRINAALAAASVNFQAYADPTLPSLPSGFIDYNTGLRLALVGAKWRTVGRLYLGVGSKWSRNRTIFDIPGLPQASPQDYVGIGPDAAYDSRDNVYQPGAGINLTYKSLYFEKSLGSAANFKTYEASLNHYKTLREGQILASRVAMEAGDGDVPFEEQAIVGLIDIRGYSNGMFRADQLYAGQAEYRWMFREPWGVVAFAGVAWSVDHASDISWGGALPGAGLGLRYLAIEKLGVNVGFDAAWGRDGNTSLAFRIGEAF